MLHSIATTNSPEQTRAFAEKFAQELKGGEVILLDGDLGAGKSEFVRGLAGGLGIAKTIVSPTFVLMKIYDVNNRGRIKRLVHVDAYRVSGRDLVDIGLLEYITAGDSIVAIEWGGKIARTIRAAKKIIRVKIKMRAENQRELIIK